MIEVDFVMKEMVIDIAKKNFNILNVIFVVKSI